MKRLIEMYPHLDNGALEEALKAIFTWLGLVALWTIITVAILFVTFVAFNHLLNAYTGDNKSARRFWRNVKRSIFS